MLTYADAFRVTCRGYYWTYYHVSSFYSVMSLSRLAVRPHLCGQFHICVLHAPICICVPPYSFMWSLFLISVLHTTYICVLHTPITVSYICVLYTPYICPPYSCMYVSSILIYVVTVSYICVLHIPYIRVLHTTVSCMCPLYSYNCFIYMCPPYSYMCTHGTIYVSSCYCIFVLILLYVCPHLCGRVSVI